LGLSPDMPLLITVAIVYATLACVIPAKSLGNSENGDAIVKITDKVIRQVIIQNNDIFDLNDERENGAFYRLGNTLHTTTREKVIRTQLLFKEGDTFSPRIINESERILRANRYLKDASILVEQSDNFVDITVSTTDTWSTKPKLGFSLGGGSSRGEIGLQVGLTYKSNPDRTSTGLKILDRHFLNSHYLLDLQHADTSDGFIQNATLRRPFYKLDSRFSTGISFSNEKRNDTLFFLEKKYFSFESHKIMYDGFIGWSRGLKDNEVVRSYIGIRQESSEFQHPNTSFDFISDEVATFVATSSLLPKNSKSIFPYYRIEYLQDKYKKTKNYQSIEVTEDRYTGLAAGLSVGYASETFGSSDDHWKVDGYVEQYLEILDNSSLELSANISFDYYDSDIVDLRSTYALKFYHTQSQFFKLYADLVVVDSKDLAGGMQIFLDSDSGLRGYPLRYLSGAQTQKITLEQRLFSSLNPFRIINLGGAIFMDIGHISGGEGFEQDKSGTYRNLGFGLRLANNRSSVSDIIHLDIAFPLDDDENSFQITLESKKTF